MQLFNLARMTVSGTPGTTSPLTLLTNVAGYLTFDQAGVPRVNQKVSYAIKDGNILEVGRGTYNFTGLTLTREPVLVTGGGQALQNFTSAAVVSIVALAQDFEEQLPPLTQLIGASGAVAEVEATKALRVALRVLSMDQAFHIGHYAVGITPVWNLGAAGSLAGNVIFTMGLPIGWPGVALVNKVQAMACTSALVGARNGNMRVLMREIDNMAPNNLTGTFIGYSRNSTDNVNGGLCSMLGKSYPPAMLGSYSINIGNNVSQSSRFQPLADITGPAPNAVGNNIPLTTLFDAWGDGGGYTPLVMPQMYGFNIEAFVPSAVTSQVVNWAINVQWDEIVMMGDFR